VHDRIGHLGHLAATIRITYSTSSSFIGRLDRRQPPFERARKRQQPVDLVEEPPPADGQVVDRDRADAMQNAILVEPGSRRQLPPDGATRLGQRRPWRLRSLAELCLRLRGLALSPHDAKTALVWLKAEGRLAEV
jgi:hypothetical protein